MRSTALSIALLLAVFTGVSTADLYRYTDSKGELHFVDDLGKVPMKYRKQVNDAEPQGNVSFTDPTPASPPPPPRERPERERRERERPKQQARNTASPKVEVFLTSWCGYCKKMVRFLNEKGIPYTAYDIEKDPAAARTHKELGGRGVPLVRVGSRVVHGYSPEAVMAYYNEGKQPD
jgi:glutaredoxin